MAAVAEIKVSALRKLDAGLDLVNNWGATSATNDASNTTYATAGAVKSAYDLASGKLGKTENAVSATKWLNGVTITLAGDATGAVSFDGATAALTLTVAVADDSHRHSFANLTSKPTTLAGYGITDAVNSTTGNAPTATKLATGRTLTVGLTGKTFDGTANVSWTLAELGALPLTGGTLTGDTFVDRGTATEPKLGVKRDVRSLYLFDNSTHQGLYSAGVTGKTNTHLIRRAVASGDVEVAPGIDAGGIVTIYGDPRSGSDQGTAVNSLVRKDTLDAKFIAGTGGTGVNDNPKLETTTGGVFDFDLAKTNGTFTVAGNWINGITNVGATAVGHDGMLQVIQRYFDNLTTQTYTSIATVDGVKLLNSSTRTWGGATNGWGPWIKSGQYENVNMYRTGILRLNVDGGTDGNYPYMSLTKERFKTDTTYYTIGEIGYKVNAKNRYDPHSGDQMARIMAHAKVTGDEHDGRIFLASRYRNAAGSTYDTATLAMERELGAVFTHSGKTVSLASGVVTATNVLLGTQGTEANAAARRDFVYPIAGGGINGDFWRSGSGTSQFGLVDHLGWHSDGKSCLVLLARKYVGTALDKTGFVGRILFNRGGVASANITDFVDVAVASAYTGNTTRLLRSSGPTVVTAKIVEVTYNSVVYYALWRASSSSSEVVVTGHAFDAALPLLIADATSYTVTDVVTMDEDYHAGNKPGKADVGLSLVDNAKQMRTATDANGYYGLVDGAGSAAAYVRTTSNGLLPYTSGGASTLGTSSWPFNTAYVKTYYENGVSLAAKYLGLEGGTLGGDLNFANSGTVSRGIQGVVGSNDYWFFGGGATATDGGYVEIASGDNGIEPIYVRQYAGAPLATATPSRSATLLDASGNTLFPGTVTAAAFAGNASSASKWATARSITLAGDATGAVSLDGSGNVTLTVAVVDNGHTHTSATITDLNAQSTAATANTLALRDSAADITARLFRSNYADQTSISGAMAFRINSSTDNYIRFCSDEAAIRTWLGVLPLAGGTMTGSLTITAASAGLVLKPAVRTDASYVLSQCGGVNQWYIGKGSVSNDDVTWHNYVHGSSISLAADRVTASKFVQAPDFYVTSDVRLKSNFEPITNALSKIKQLTGKLYDKGGLREAGLIAQDVQQVQPESVSTNAEGFLSISHSGLVALLVEAVKELDAKLEGLLHAQAA